MRSLFHGRWIRNAGHPDDETLLLSLEGELAGARKRETDAHVEQCWQCRRRRERLERGISDFVDYLTAPGAFPPPPRAWAGFEARLHRAAAEQVRAKRVWRWPAVLSLRYGAVAAAACLVVLWILVGSTGRMSAKELLDRAESSALRQFQSVEGPVVYQKVQVRRTARRGRRATVATATAEFWSDRARARFRRTSGGAELDELDTVLRRNSMDPQEPLSAAAFARWRQSVALAHEQVKATRLSDGSAAWELSTAVEAPHVPGGIMEGRLVIRAIDWHPIANTLEVSDGGDAIQYQITELAYDVQPRSILGAVFGADDRPAAPPPGIAALPPITVTPPVAPPPAADLDSLEVEVRYTLHALGLCRGGAVEVSRGEAATVVVRGLIGSAEERDQLRTLLPNGVAVDLLTPAELRDAEPGRTVSETTVPPAEPALLQFPAGKRIAEYFRARVPAQQVGARMYGLANEAVALAQSMAVEAGALRTLLDAVPRERAASLRPASQRLLAGMLDDHASAFDRAAHRQRLLLDEVLGALGGDAPVEYAAPESASELVAAALEAERLTVSLLTQTNDPPASVEQTAARLRAALSELGGGSRMTQAVRQSVFAGNIPQTDARRNQ